MKPLAHYARSSKYPILAKPNKYSPVQYSIDECIDLMYFQTDSIDL